MDINLRLACAQHLQQQGVLPLFEKETWYKTDQDIDYSDTAPYNYSAQDSIFAWYAGLGVEKQLEHITALTWSPDSDPIQDIWTYWDGEDDTFTIHSLEGIQGCTRLESIRIESLLKCDDLMPLTSLPALKKLHFTGVVIANSDENTKVVEALLQQSVEVIITSAQKDGLSVDSRTIGMQQESSSAVPFDISVPPISPERCIEVFNALFPRLAKVLDSGVHVDTTKLKTTQYTSPMPRNPRRTEEPPDQTTTETHYNEQASAVQYHNFCSIVIQKNGTVTQTDIRAMIQLIPNEADLIEIAINARPAGDPSRIETIHVSTTMVTADQKVEIKKILVDAFSETNKKH